MLRFHWKWTDYERNQVRHMQQTFRSLIEQMGGHVQDPMPPKEKGYGIAKGGSIIPRAWYRPDGQRSFHLGAQPILPDP